VHGGLTRDLNSEKPLFLARDIVCPIRATVMGDNALKERRSSRAQAGCEKYSEGSSEVDEGQDERRSMWQEACPYDAERLLRITCG
jgi:hypothetical protein